MNFSSILAGLTGSQPSQEAPAQTQPSEAPAKTSEPVKVEQTPAEFFGKLFEHKDEPQKDSKEEAVNPWDVNADTLTKSFGNLDVSSFVNKEDVAAAMGGDADAFMKVLNTAVQIGAMSSHQASVNLTKQGVELSTSKLQQELPNKFKDFSLNSALNQDPVLSSPDLQPIVTKVKDAILKQYPKATEGDIKQGVLAYLSNVANKFGDKPASTNDKETSDIDWESHFKNM